MPRLDRSRIGIITPLKGDGRAIRPVVDFGLTTCQVGSWDPGMWTPKAAELCRQAADENGVTMVAFWAGWPGPKTWDFLDGPTTLGIIPAEYRAMRVDALKQGARFAKLLGVPALVTHLGFIPENPRDELFAQTVDAVKDLARFMGDLGLEFWFETGQETPVTVLRLISEVGEPNLGVNLDPANLILYGKANPIDSISIFGSWIKCVHAKDGLYPTDPMKLGREVPVGQGAVRFEEFVDRLESTGFTGAYIIEREIEGDQQVRDIRRTVDFLTGASE
jgi:sugar phosphate isomerase/epimerase